MKGLLKIFAQGAVAAAGTVAGSMITANAVGALSDPVKKAKMKNKITNIKNKILRK